MDQTINAPAPPKIYQHALICLLIVAAALTVYWNIGACKFICFDDNLYVTENKQIQQGLSIDNMLWSFKLDASTNRAYWHPLTWMSHMLDCQLFGLDAGKHHLVNLAIHIINALLLYLALNQMTGAMWKSAFVAALFAVHPLNVDSVAWIAERKNLLSTLFWFLTMLCYGYYARRPSLYRYLLVFTAMTAGLLSKPMLVTLPCVLLLLDFWPLNRIKGFPDGISGANDFHRLAPGLLIAEKIPLLALSIISIILSIFSLRHYDQIIPGQAAPMGLRIENAIVSYAKYITKILWPHDMAIYYPFPASIPVWQVAAAFVFLATAFAIIAMPVKKAPFMAVGWLWFIGTLLPVIGIIQGGRWPAIADRWTYVPAIGIFIMISWGGAALLQRLSIKTPFRAITALGILAVLMIISHHQLRYWKNNIALFSHALDVTENNDVAHYNMAVQMTEQGNMDQVMQHYEAALKINPKLAEAYNNIGNILVKKRKTDPAIEQFQLALKYNPHLTQAHINLGNALMEKGFIDSAIEHFNRALEQDPEQKETHINLGKALARKGALDQAIGHFHQAIKLDPKSAIAHNNLGNALAEKGAIDQAIDEFNMTIKLNPNYTDVHNNLGNAYIRKGRLDEALYQYETIITKSRKDVGDTTIKNRDTLLSLLKPADQVNILFKTAVRFAGEKKYEKGISLFQRILSITPDNPAILYNISCLYALLNQKEQALQWLQKAVDHGYDNWGKLKTDPDLNHIKNEPGYRKLVEKGGKHRE